ncbi:hypothetical protein FACS189454_08250 [Planctomycetales bacterium]|nr:hypothetical protein FACS189454_08250 [Planctomycetales bacterium]
MTLSKTIDYSEQKMADAFGDFLRSATGISKLAEFDTIVREVDCSRGRPDYLGVRLHGGCCFDEPLHPIGEAGAHILSLLKPAVPRTFNYLRSQCVYTDATLKRTLRNLIELGYVKPRQDTSAYFLGEKYRFTQCEIWSFELKLHNARRAVFQAQQSRVFADRSMIVVPPGRENVYAKFDAPLKRFGIGLAVFDLYALDFHIVVSPGNTKAICRQNQIYTLFQIGSLEKNLIYHR